MDDGVTYDESWLKSHSSMPMRRTMKLSDAGQGEWADYDVEAYDEAFAAYLDARRRFQDLKLPRGFTRLLS